MLAWCTNYYLACIFPHLIGSRDCLCPLWLAGVITLVWFYDIQLKTALLISILICLSMCLEFGSLSKQRWKFLLSRVIYLLDIVLIWYCSVACSLLMPASLTSFPGLVPKPSRKMAKTWDQKQAAPVLSASNTLPNNSDVISPPAMFQPPSAIFPPLSQTNLRPWSPVYPPFPVNTAIFPLSGTFKPPVFNRNSNFPSAESQTVSVMVRPRVSASASPPLSLSTSPINNLMSQYQASCESDSGESRHTVDDYLAAVTLASGFQREI